MRSPSLRSRSGSSIPAAEPPLQPADPPPDAAASPPPTSTPAADHKQAGPHDADSISHASSAPPLSPPPPYDGPAAAPAHGRRCAILPAHEARWRTKGNDDDSTPLSTLAATVLVSEGQLEGGDVQLLLPPDSSPSPTDPLSAIALSTYATVHEIVLGAAEGPREAYRQLRRAREEAQAKEAQAYDYRSLLLGSAEYDDDNPDHDRFGDYRPTAPPSVASSMADDDGRERERVCYTPSATTTGTVVSGTARGEGESDGTTVGMGMGMGRVKAGEEGGGNPYAAVAARTGLGVARIVGAGLKAPGVYTRGLARGFNNVPRLYGDETVREEDRIDGVASGLVAAGKGLGYGLFDGITGLFVQPVKGAQKEGPVGFLKGFGKGLGGIVCKPAAGKSFSSFLSDCSLISWKTGALGVPGYAFTGIQRSIEKELSRKASPEECLAAAEVLHGEDEMRRLSDKERMDIVAAWLAR
ncbi:hypothetical protein SLS58_003404 [Diplodia intermedia]|uniref:Uncharacterized protein n=1 Tax=Diplodia intermedia TaxID=856260 RepID=A0ABR3TWY3_9PEZI